MDIRHIRDGYVVEEKQFKKTNALIRQEVEDGLGLYGDKFVDYLKRRDKVKPEDVFYESAEMVSKSLIPHPMRMMFVQRPACKLSQRPLLIGLSSAAKRK